MSVWDGIAARARALLRGTRADQELDEEIRFHLERETEEHVRRGLPPDEARRRALASFGGVQQTREAHREVRGLPWAGEVARDVRYALRTLRRSPTLAGAAIVTLALGIGANTAIFSAVNAVILRPLPFADPARLVMLWETNPEFHWYQATAAPANVLDWREQVPAFADVAMYEEFTGDATLSGAGEPRRVPTAIVTGNFFSVLGMHAEAGRTLEDAETWKTGNHVAVISDRLWREQLSGDPKVVGRTIMLDGTPLTVVGIMPPSFGFPTEATDAWVPTHWDRDSRAQVWFRRAHWVRAIARLRPGILPEQANVQLQAVVRRLQQEYPVTNRVMGAGLTPLHAFLVRETRRPLLILLGAVALLLLIACANVANLLLVRAAGREREAALRLTLGAGRGRLVRQAITESLVLSLLGGVMGIAVGWGGTRALLALQPPGMLPVHAVDIDWSVLIYVAAITTLTGLAFGAAPAFWVGHRAPAEVLKEGGRAGSVGRRARRWGDALVIGEVAVALLLAVGAGLLVRTFRALEQVDPGFEPHGVLTADVPVAGPRYDRATKVRAFYDELLARARALPGVTAAAETSRLPLTDWGWTSQLVADGWPAGRYAPEVAHREQTPGYFQVMHVPIIRGRDFGPQDTPAAPKVVLINQALARQYFPGEDPIGRRVTFDKVPDSTSVWRTIIGVVGDEHQTRLGVDTKIQAIAPFSQDWRTDMKLVLRTDGDAAALGPAVRRIVAELDPTLVVSSMRTMDEVRAASLAEQRFLMSMLLMFAAVGVVLAVVGVYGVCAQLARGRTREMGIRIALGARAAQVRWLVLRHGLLLAGAGLAIGLGAASIAARSIRAFLFGVTPVDPVTFLAVPLLLLAAAAIAMLGPAWRAARADPAVTLREE